MKNEIIINIPAKTMTVSKAFYKKASIYGTAEYFKLRNALKDNLELDLVVMASQKKSYRDLTYKRMEAYIKTQDNSEANLTEFKAVKEIAKVKGSAYPLTKKWFLVKFPEYKLSEVSDTETETIIKRSKDSTTNSPLKAVANY